MKAEIKGFKDSEHLNEIADVIRNFKDKVDFFIDFVNMKIIVVGENKDVLHKKCTWLVKKADKEKTLYYDIDEERSGTV